jgi:hypothetical protein
MKGAGALPNVHQLREQSPHILQKTVSELMPVAKVKILSPVGGSLGKCNSPGGGTWGESIYTAGAVVVPFLPGPDSEKQRGIGENRKDCVDAKLGIRR